MLTHTSTYTLLPVALLTFEDIKVRLEETGSLSEYLDDDHIKMQGLAVVVEQLHQSTGGLHQSVKHVLQFFAYEHLPTYLQAVSRPFCLLAHDLANSLPGNPETTAALRKLLEAKDCAVRAILAG